VVLEVVVHMLELELVLQEQLHKGLTEEAASADLMLVVVVADLHQMVEMLALAEQLVTEEMELRLQLLVLQLHVQVVVVALFSHQELQVQLELVEAEQEPQDQTLQEATDLLILEVVVEQLQIQTFHQQLMVATEDLEL
jgi:hypothetical protein